jgi:CMP-N,N'-diacetyllegionaminic acid synthase
MSRLILIPARGGSTRIPDKNLRQLRGKPLLGHVIEAATRADCGRVIVSTNSEEIAAIARNFHAEVPFLRPSHLASATSNSLSAILHALMTLRAQGDSLPELLAFCPPTNPMIRPETIRGMFEVLGSRRAFNSVVTITRPRTHPFRIIRKMANGRIVNGVIEIDGKSVNDIERSQDWPVVWEGSPACRMTRTRYFVDLIEQSVDPLCLTGKTYDVANCLGYEIPPEEAFDIDEEMDFVTAEGLLSDSRHHQFAMNFDDS